MNETQFITLTVHHAADGTAAETHAFHAHVREDDSGFHHATVRGVDGQDYFSGKYEDGVTAATAALGAMIAAAGAKLTELAA